MWVFHHGECQSFSLGWFIIFQFDQLKSIADGLSNPHNGQVPAQYAHPAAAMKPWCSPNIIWRSCSFFEWQPKSCDDLPSGMLACLPLTALVHTWCPRLAYLWVLDSVSKNGRRLMAEIFWEWEEQHKWDHERNAQLARVFCVGIITGMHLFFTPWTSVIQCKVLQVRIHELLAFESLIQAQDLTQGEGQ